MSKSSRGRRAPARRPEPEWEDVPLIPDEDQPDGVDVALSPAGRAFFQPVEQRAARGLTGPKQAALADLQEHARSLAIMREHLAALVEECREQGISWSLIGWSLGITGEGARKMYGRPSEGDG